MSRVEDLFVGAGRVLSCKVHYNFTAQEALVPRRCPLFMLVEVATVQAPLGYRGGTNVSSAW